MNFKSLLPLIVFIAVFLGSGIISGDFYALPAPIAVFAGIKISWTPTMVKTIQRPTPVNAAVGP